MEVNVRDFRMNLSHYLDLVEKGEELLLIRRSYPIGKIVPIQNVDKEVKSRIQGPTIRQLNTYEDPIILVEFIKAVDENVEDLINPHGYYEVRGGELWFVEDNGNIIGIGSYVNNEDGNAMLNRLFITGTKNNRAIAQNLFDHLCERAIKNGYRGLIKK